MELHELKHKLQQSLTDGLVLIVGSGLSAALGLPTMWQLAEHLQLEAPKAVPPSLKEEWAEIHNELQAGTDIESVLTELDVNPDLEEIIVNIVGDYVETKEKSTISQIILGNIENPIPVLIEKLMRTVDSISIVTTNYDRLIEFSAESVGIGVDTLFVGQNFGVLDPALSREALGTARQTRNRAGIKRVYRKHVRVLKPHGSLDWYNFRDSPIRSGMALELPRLIVTPGKTKYLKGYNQPFDTHREAANKAIDQAARFLVIGYGFRDQELESHLRRQIDRGVPCVILTRTLTTSSAEVVQANASVIALTKDTQNDTPGTKLSQGGDTSFYSNISLWDLTEFIGEVM